MPGELLIAASPGEWRAALLEDGIPVELYVERGDRSEIGSIHLGRVRRLLPGLGAMLVDIGGDRPAFLPQSEVLPRGRRLHEGERVIVQIRRETQGGKAARVTTGVALGSGLIELRLGRPGIIGGEMLAPDERAALSSIAEEDAAGLRVLRPAPIDTLLAAATGLNRRWRQILNQTAHATPPARLDPTLSFGAALAGTLAASPTHVITDDLASIPELRAAFPEAVTRHRPEPEWSIDLAAVFDRALSQTVELDSGGAVHIELTRTAVLIDVDSRTPEAGSPARTALAVNLVAANAIARQIRLRNLGGGIVIDFIGLEDRRARERVREALAEALAPDPRCPKILGWTRLGHLELVRPRRGRPIVEALLEPRRGGLFVKTALTLAHEALRALRLEAGARPGRSWRLIVAPDVVAALAGGAAAAALVALEARFARKITIEPDSGLEREQFQIVPL